MAKVPGEIKRALDKIRTTIIESAVLEVLLEEPFPLASEIDGCKRAIILKVIEAKGIKGNPENNIAYVMSQKAVCFFVFSSSFLCFSCSLHLI
jgi:hypothetical protein